MFKLIVTYISKKGNVGNVETIASFNSLEEATQMWEDFCNKNSNDEYFEEEGYNTFYIEGDDGCIEECYCTERYGNDDLIELLKEKVEQDDFTERVCENCNKDFDIKDPHYYDEENGVCYCSEECYKIENN